MRTHFGERELNYVVVAAGSLALAGFATAWWRGPPVALLDLPPMLTACIVCVMAIGVAGYGIVEDWRAKP